MINRMRKVSQGSGATSKPAKPVSTAFYEELFNKFKDSEDSDSIGPEGMQRLCDEIDVDPSDVLMLVFAWCLGASQMGYFSREEWLSAVGKVGDVTSEAELKERMDGIHKRSLREPEALRELHRFAHKFCREERKKNIDVGSACIMLQMLLAPLYKEHVESISRYLEQHAEVGKRGVSLDEWTMLLQFCREIHPDCDNFQDDGAWPLLLDDYVEWRREQSAQGGAAGAEGAEGKSRE